MGLPTRLGPRPPSTEAQAFTDAFYEWEAWGRGWLQAPEPVSFALPIQYPNWHRRPNVADDTYRPHWIKRLIARRSRPPARHREVEDALELQRGEELRAPVEVEIVPRPESRFSAGLARSWSASLATLTTPLSFELLRVNGQSTIRLAYPPDAHALVSSSLRSVAPDVELRATAGLRSAWLVEGDSKALGTEYALAREFVWSLDVGASDFVASLVVAFDELAPDESGLWQVLLKPISQSSQTLIALAGTGPTGQVILSDAPGLERAAQQKSAEPLFAVVARALLRAPDASRLFALSAAVQGSLSRLSGENALVPLSDTDTETLERDVLSRVSRRLGMVLTRSECSALVALPYQPGECPGLALHEDRPTPPARRSGVLLGESPTERGASPVRLSTEDRLRHVHVIGASGAGKSNLLLSMMLQDIESGGGLALLDPHGDLADALLARIPEEREQDVVVLDPTDPDYLVGFNVLDAEAESERELLASDLVGAFRRLSTSWGDQMTTVLANAVLTFLDASEPATLLELRRFLSNERFQARFLQNVSDPYLRAFWQDEWPLLKSRRPQIPILTRLDGLLRQKRVRDVLTLREGALDFRALLDERRILIARLAQGQIGRDNASLLGVMLVTRLQQAGLSRADERSGMERSGTDDEVSVRSPFFVYLDEFHEVATPSMATFFSGIRKYGLGLTVAHHDLYQLTKTDKELERAVLANAHVRVAFRVGDEDARTLERGFQHFEAPELTALPIGSAIARIGGSASDFRLSVPLVTALEPGAARARREAVEAKSRARYSVPRPPAPSRAESVEEPVEALCEDVMPKPRSTSVAAPTERTSTEPEPIKTEQAPALTSASKPKDEGRGGPEHRYLQSLIRSWATERGYRAELEVELDDGGRADLIITLAAKDEEEKSEQIAVEISVTTGLAHELAHAKSRLNEGFAHVALVSPRRATRAKLHDEVSGWPEALSGRLAVYAPEEFLSWLQTRPIATDQVAGYRVTTQSSSESVAVAAERRERLNRVIAGSLRKLKAAEKEGPKR